MPLSRHHVHYNAPFAARLAAHYEYIELVTHRPDGVLLPAPVPALSPRQRVEARVYALELFERRMCDLLANPVPEVRYADH